MKGAAPLRFVVIVLGGWVCARAIILAPPWTGTGKAVEPTINNKALAEAELRPRPWPNAQNPVSREARSIVLDQHRGSSTRGAIPQLPNMGREPVRLASAPSALTAELPRMSPATDHRPEISLITSMTRNRSNPRLRAISRWSASAWLFVRRGEGRQLAATGGVLGGSQAGARFGYRLNDDAARPISLSARFYSPLRRTRDAEAAFGIEWKPLGNVPVSLLAERRQSLRQDGRSAFALMAYGGVSERPVLGALRLDAYAQAGVVGAKRKEKFADGAATLSLPIDEEQKLTLGIGAWGAAQPGVSRFDLGPQFSYRLPVQGQPVRLSAEWRLRVSGDAAPASGPAITLSTAF